VSASDGGRREEILEQFVELVAEKGYDGTNLGELARRIGISKGTIVHHFTSKDRMLAESHLRYIRRRLAEARALIAGLPSAPERVAALLHAFILYQHEDRAATIAFQRETVRFRENEVMAEAQHLRDEFFELLAGALRTGFDDGTLRTPRHGDARLTALAMLGSAHWAWTWYDPKGRGRPEDVAAAFIEVYLGGLLADDDRGGGNGANLDALADPDGPLPAFVRATVEATRPAP
jgi:TetR/AcrR family transcriptional regulator, cholesterol catabolism regulator